MDGLVGVTIHYLAGTTGWEAFEGLESEIWVLPESTAIVSPGITEAQFGFVVIGPGSHVVVEVTNDLDKPGWKPLATLTLSGGSADFADPEWTGYRNRFYRVRLP